MHDLADAAQRTVNGITVASDSSDVQTVSLIGDTISATGSGDGPFCDDV
jgi:hypothetical protein